ncbi:hypothetical protein OIU77_018379 [Salix suchowensis]|uniref:Uncharacterized protein n=1 Tax=Salix suchowensis TaxID=1278906 RepID=A0ABQ9CCE6_9ROSI|nr:hypothetical protein OIU77_018379 [Salix suchowensis]
MIIASRAFNNIHSSQPVFEKWKDLCLNSHSEDHIALRVKAVQTSPVCFNFMILGHGRVVCIIELQSYRPQLQQLTGVERSGKMERTQKMLLILAIFILVLASNVEAGRKLEEKEKVDQPQNYLGGFGTSGGFIPSPNGPVFQLGPTVYCSYPGVGCVNIPGTGSIGSPP